MMRQLAYISLQTLRARLCLAFRDKRLSIETTPGNPEGGQGCLASLASFQSCQNANCKRTTPRLPVASGATRLLVVVV